MAQAEALKFKVKAVMIDLDGTLIHTAPEIAVAINWTMIDLGLPELAPEKIEAYIGEGAQMLIKRCLAQQLGAEPDAILREQAEATFFVHYAKNVAESKPYNGVIDGLQALWNKGLKLACVLISLSNLPCHYCKEVAWLIFLS